jgi:hypothetical protein
MERNGRPRRRLEASSAPTSLHEITRRYYATAIALAKAMGVPMSETFLQAHRESISCCFIESGRAGVRLPPAVQLPPLGIETSISSPASVMDDGLSALTPAVATLDGAVGSSDVTPLPPGEGEATMVSTNGDAPLPTRIPTGDNWPCAGHEIAQLKPAQLHLVLAKAGFRAHADTTLMPLLAALQIERAKRIEQGKRRNGEGPQE